MITTFGCCSSYTESCKYSDTWEQMQPLFVLGADVIGDICHVFVM